MTDTTDYRTTHAGAWRRGHESAAIYQGDGSRLDNPYPSRSADALAFAAGWNAWVIATMDARMAGYAAAVRRGEVGE